jgi:phosphoenolpyruvate---glycerone phosphotransferase subunit DhaL
MITNSTLIQILDRIGDTIHENKAYLTELDTAIGDSDHGINMNKGFTAVKGKLDSVSDKDCGTILKTVAMTLISTVGGASGPLYGTAFLKAASVANGKMELNLEDVVHMYDEAIQGIIARGKAKKGDKTMLDALLPAFESFKASLESNEDLSTAYDRAEEAALKGVEFTKTIAATKGRANYLGERSIGHQDPGATSSYLMIKTTAEVLRELK